MTKEIEVKSIKEVMLEKGYSEEARNAAARVDEKGKMKIIPAQTYLKYDNVLYIAVMPDDSASIAGKNKLNRDNTQDVIDGHNDIIEALKSSKEARKILYKTQYLNNDEVLNNWVPLNEAKRMARENFKPEGSTPLYDKTISFLSSVILEKARALKRGQKARWGILVISDADDTSSVSEAKDVKVILDNMREKGELLGNCEPDNSYAGSISFMGIDDGTTPFEKIARSMGINWVIRADRMNPTEMRRAFK